MKKILYFGIIQFKYENAMCQRVKGIKKLIEEIGYEIIEIGVDESANIRSHIRIDDNVFAIKEPKTIKEWIKSCYDTKCICEIIEQYNFEDIEALIRADYRLIPMFKMKKYCERHNIKFVVDIMDWFPLELSIKGFIKKIDNELRMKLFYPFLDRKIYICTQFEKKWKKGEFCRVIPGVVIQKNKLVNYNHEKIQLVFAGRPEKKCKKEKINWIIKAINQGENKNKFNFYIAGITKSQFINENPEYEQYVNENIIFLGRIPHEQCVDIIRKSDFSVVIRPNNKLSNYGFSTKIGESFSYNIPVIATDTSDNKLYIKNSVNGFICGCDYMSLEKMITEIGKLSNDEIFNLKKNIYASNPLFYNWYINRLQDVLGD